MPDKLVMKFQPRTLQHLGIKMYNQAPAAIAELIANAYDADATKVEVKLYNENEKKIVVQDNGIGMTFKELNDKFLQIGRNRREAEKGKTLLDRFPSGKKGLGKLALFGLGNIITVQTKSQSSSAQSFSMNWLEIQNESGEYSPILKTDCEQLTNNGTQITVSELKRVSPFDQNDIANGIARLFHCFDDNFIVSVSVNDGVPIQLNNNSKFESINDIQFEWKDFSQFQNSKYIQEKHIIGKIITTTKPLKSGLRGITLFANGRLINLPEFFGQSESSHFYSYTTGILNVDFIDEGHGEDDLIATNRQSLNWEHTVTKKLKEKLQDLLNDIQQDWRKKRKKEAEEQAKPTQDFNYQKWLDTLPADKATTINVLLDTKMEDNDQASRKDIVETLHSIAPEYAEFHWRYLHKKLQASKRIKEDYSQRNYFSACDEAIKIYIHECKTISSLYEHLEQEIIKQCFSIKKGAEPKIELVEKEEHILIFNNIQTGYEHISLGVLAAFRNVLSHNPEDIVTQFIPHKDCLDVLSLVSHLFTKLDNRHSPRITS